MAKDREHDMSDQKPSPPSRCLLEMAPTLAALRKSLADAARLTAAAAADERESVEADVCLASRSAYFDLYTWLVIEGEVDEPAERELDGLFRQALALMAPGQFRASVAERYDEFKEECDRLRRGSVHSGAASPV